MKKGDIVMYQGSYYKFLEYGHNDTCYLSFDMGRFCGKFVVSIDEIVFIKTNE